MALTETQVLANELEVTRRKVPVLFERDSYFYGNIKSRPVEKISARDMRVPLELRPGSRFGYFDSAGGDLGRGSGPTFDKAVVNTVNVKLAVEWQKKAQWATDSSRKAVINTFRHLLAKSMVEFRKQNDSQLMGSNDGALGTVSAVSTTSNKDTLTLNSGGFGAKLVRAGQYVSLYKADFSALRAVPSAVAKGDKEDSSVRIDSVDIPNKQIKMAGEFTSAAATDRVVASGLSGANPVGLQGVQYHNNSSSSGTWMGLSRATFPEIRANSVAAGGALAVAHARLALNKVMDRAGLENGTKMQAWMHLAQAAQYEALGQGIHRIDRPSGGKNPGLDLYFDIQQIAGVPIKKHNSWDRTRIDFIVNESWGRAEMHPAGYYEEDGIKLFPVRGSSGGVAAASLFYIVAAYNIFMDNPMKAVYISGLTIPTGY